MKIHEDRSHMNIDTRWFEKGYAKEDVHSLLGARIIQTFYGQADVS